MTYRLEFTIPDLPKLPNQLLGAHWTIRSGHAKAWKRKVWRCVWHLKPSEPLKKASLTLTRGSSREADFDGLVGSFKAIIDGLVEAQVLAGDTQSIIGQPCYQWTKAKRGAGFIRVLIEGHV